MTSLYLIICRYHEREKTDLKLFLTQSLYTDNLTCLTLIKIGKKESMVKLLIRINLTHRENYRGSSSQAISVETAVMPKLESTMLSEYMIGF